MCGEGSRTDVLVDDEAHQQKSRAEKEISSKANSQPRTSSESAGTKQTRCVVCASKTTIPLPK